MNDKTILEVGGLRLDKESRRVYLEGEEIILTPTEFALLQYLMVNKGRVLSREMILNGAWGYFIDETRMVDVYIGYLRRKIDKGPRQYILTRRGFGYFIP